MCSLCSIRANVVVFCYKITVQLFLPGARYLQFSKNKKGSIFTSPARSPFKESSPGYQKDFHQRTAEKPAKTSQTAFH